MSAKSTVPKSKFHKRILKPITHLLLITYGSSVCSRGGSDHPHPPDRPTTPAGQAHLGQTSPWTGPPRKKTRTYTSPLHTPGYGQLAVGTGMQSCF